MLAWIGRHQYAQVRYDRTTGQLTSRVLRGSSTASTSTSTPTPTSTSTATHTATDAAGAAPTTGATPSPTATSDRDSTAGRASSTGPDPRGSDLWLEQFTGSSAPTTRLAVPDSVSVIIATDGSTAAPTRLEVSWPLDAATPWAGPLLVAGGVFALLGVLLYLWALHGWRRSRGPRRSGPTMPKLPRSRRYKPVRALPTPKAGRRSIRRRIAVVPVVLVGSLAFAGCSSDYWPQLQSEPTPTATPSTIASDLPGQGTRVQSPAVTENQLREIIDRIAAVTTKADQSLDADEAATRFSGPALAERRINYLIRSKKSDEPGSPTITDQGLRIALPQATDTWPRSVLAVQKPTDDTQAPVVMVLRQTDPRENYHVEYAMALQASAQVPGLAPVNVGTSVVPPDTKLLKVAPERIAAEYGDILTQGDASKYADAFQADGDTLRVSDGAAAKAKVVSDVGDTATAAFSSGPGDGDTVALATNKSGALVATSWTQTTSVTPKANPNGKVTVNVTGPSALISGLTSTEKGFTTTYGYQMLFYVPPSGSDQKIRLLGYSIGPLSSSELP